MNNTEKREKVGFEKFIFGVTRIFALCGAAIVLIAIVVLAMKLLAPAESTTVTYAEVVRELSGSEDSSDSEAKETTSSNVPIVQISIPDNLKPYLGGNNENILKTWVADLSEDQQKDFLKNMSAVVREAIIKNINPTEAINAYKSIKFRKLNEADSFEKYSEMATKFAYFAAIFGLLLILSIISLVLVMLTIERHTRPQSA